MTAQKGDPERLERALEIAMAWREAGEESAAALLARHADLRDLLSALVGEPEGEADEPEQQLGDFVLDVELGRGSMGTVYAADQQSLGRRVALKVMRGGLDASERQVARFRREAVLTARLDHPHVVRLLEFGIAGERLFFAMDLVDGAPLSRVYQAMAAGQELRAAVTTMTGRDSSWSEDHFPALALLIGQVARALQHAHEHDVIHRDVKPSNILVRPDRVAQLADFGIARERDVPSMTATGEFAGTPHYVSPEQVRGDLAAIDGRSDVFSLGATLYEGLTSRPPFDAESSHDVVQRILTEQPRDPRSIRPDVPRDLAAIAMKALEKAPADRYATAAEMAADLEAFVERRPVQARPIPRLRRLGRWARRSPLKVAALSLATIACGLLGYLLSIQSDADRGAQARLAARVDELVTKGFSNAAKGSALVAREVFRTAVELDPQCGEAWVGWALSWLNHQQPDDAWDVLSRAPELEDATAQRSLSRTRAIVLRALDRAVEAGEIEAELGECQTDFEWFAVGMDHLMHGHHSGRAPEYVLAKQCFDRAIATADGPNPMFQCQRAHVAGHLLDRADAELWSRILLDQWPNSSHAMFFAGFAIEWCDRERAIELYRKAARSPGAESLHADHLASGLMRAKRPEEAVEALREAGTRWPGTAYLDFRRGETLLTLGRREQAMQAFEAALAEDRSRPLPKGHRGTVLMRLGRYQEAREWLEQRVAEAPRNPLGWISLSLSYTLPRDYEGGVQVLRRAVASLPDHVMLRHRLGSCLKLAGKLEASREAFLACLAIDPEHARALDALSQVLVAMKRTEEAIEVLDRAVQLPDVRVSSLCRRANLHRWSKENDRARALYERAAKRSPNYPDTYYHWAWLEVQAKNDELAAELYRKVFEMAPKMVGPARDGARFFDFLGDVETMRAFYQRAVELRPKDQRLHEQVVESFTRHKLLEELAAENERWRRASGG